MADKVANRREGAILHVVNDNPGARNALGPDYYKGLTAALGRAAADTGIAAVVLSGAGGFFCAGGDLNALRTRAAMSVPERLQAIEGLHGVIRAIRACPRPVIAAVEGGAAGAGASLALACDLIVAGEDAYFALSYLRVGLTPDGGATHALTSALPRQMASEILMLGDRQPAARLAALGLVNRVVAPERVLDEAVALGERLADLGPGALASVKRLIGQAGTHDLDHQLAREAAAMAEAQGGEEAAEGIRAFLEKRPPDFRRFRK